MDRTARETEIQTQVGTILKSLTDAEFVRLSGNGHEAWLESELQRAIFKVAGRNTGPKSGIVG